mmetsp:Transcript_22167/g.54868  ORF Transcript_22167/g.54868 Transcript_22167/m.54868 type:complete len:238 (+) Transcript_22167:324-1037(+)
MLHRRSLHLLRRKHLLLLLMLRLLLMLMLDLLLLLLLDWFRLYLLLLLNCFCLSLCGCCILCEIVVIALLRNLQSRVALWWIQIGRNLHVHRCRKNLIGMVARGGARQRSMVTGRLSSQNGRHGGLCRDIRRIGIARWSLLVFRNHALEFFFRKIKNFGRQCFVGIDVSIQGWIPDIGSDVFVVVVVTTAVGFEFAVDGHGHFGGNLAPLLGRSLAVFFSVPFLSFDVSVSFANELR